MATFKPQLTVPLTTDKWYIRLSSGGYSPCIAGVPLRQKGSALANCVGYAWGRIAFLENNKKCDIGVPASRLRQGKYNPTSAQYWIACANGRTVNKSTPKLGAVMVWKHTNSTSGHVAVVEEINNEKKQVTASMSGYGSKGYVFKTEVLPFNGARKNCTFLGYIYPKVDFTPEPTNTLKKGAKVQIIATGNSRVDGKGKVSKGIGYKRYILAVYSGQPYPYKVGNKLGITTGYYKATALKKI